MDKTSLGNFYYCIKMSEQGEEVYAYADGVDVDQGALRLWNVDNDGRTLNLMIAQGEWRSIGKASYIDGDLAAVEQMNKKSITLADGTVVEYDNDTLPKRVFSDGHMFAGKDGRWYYGWEGVHPETPENRVSNPQKHQD